MARRSVIFLLMPGVSPVELDKYMQRGGFTRCKELKPNAGMRRFKLS